MLAVVLVIAGIILWQNRQDDVSATSNIWGDQAPVGKVFQQGGPLELGTQFTPKVDGQIEAIRYYSPAASSVSVQGHLWSPSGALMGTVTFAAGTSSGWRTAQFDQSIELTSGSVYTASYTASDGTYFAANGFFAQNPPPAQPIVADKGVFSAGGAFPSAEYNSTNYFVDIVYSAQVPVNASATGQTVNDSPQTEAQDSIRDPAAYPNSDTAGVPKGTELQKSGSVTLDQEGEVADGLDVDGTINIKASHVVLRNSRVTAADYTVVKVADGLTGVHIENVLIDGKGMSGAPGSTGISGPADIVAADISGVENGVAPSSNASIRASFIHDLAAPGPAHYDGIQIDGGATNIIIEGNSIDLTELDQTSTVMVDNFGGPSSMITVQGNRLRGGGYTVYSDGQFSGGAMTGVVFDSNRLGVGVYGYSVVRQNMPQWSNNVDDVTGQQVPMGK